MDLKPIGLFAEMSDGDLKKLGKQMREVRHPKGVKPVLRGKDGVGFMVILEGQAEVSTVDGRHRLLGPGDHFGEMALLDQQGRSADITARTDLVSAAMVGRDDELSILEDALLSALRGDGGAVVIGGEAGMGKTRLVHELIRR